MKLGRCFFCNKIAAVVFHVTEINDGTVESVDLCSRCGHEYISSLENNKKPNGESDLTKIQTPEDLLGFIASLATKKKPSHEPCPLCGTTLEAFDQAGRFGCPGCYDHFNLLMEKVVFPYHGASEHVGKRPKHAAERRIDEDPAEKVKLLKLRLAQAVELEEYERAAIIHEEIKQLTQSLPSSSSDQ